MVENIADADNVARFPPLIDIAMYQFITREREFSFSMRGPNNERSMIGLGEGFLVWRLTPVHEAIPANEQQ